MSFLRASTFARHATASARRFSTEAPKKASNLPYVLLGASAVGFGAYYALGGPSGTTIPKVLQQTKSPLDPDNFVDFKLKKVVPYNHNTASFVFELPKGEASLLPVASCLVIKSSDPAALVDGKGKPVIRPYTPVSAPDHPGELVLLIKRYEAGTASKYIHDQLKPGDTLAIKGPIPKFPYKANEFDEVALIGGGSGITPLWQIVTHALADPKNKTRFTLLFANITEADILLRDELDGLQKKHPEHFKVVHALDTADDKWAGARGYINAELLKNNIAPPTLGEKVKVFVCGPPGQVNAVAGKKAGMNQGELGGVLKELGYSEEQVYKF